MKFELNFLLSRIGLCCWFVFLAGASARAASNDPSVSGTAVTGVNSVMNAETSGQAAGQPAGKVEGNHDADSPAGVSTSQVIQQTQGESAGSPMDAAAGSTPAGVSGQAQEYDSAGRPLQK